MKSVLAIALVSACSVAAEAGTTKKTMMPHVASAWWTVAGDPDLGNYTTPKQQPVDFGIWQAGDGSWQLWSCIRGTKCGGVTRLFHGWQSQKLTATDWQALGITMEAQPESGETPGGLQAPFVIQDENRFLMFYGNWEQICVATSRDGKHFYRRVGADGKTGMFGEGAGNNARDPMVLFTRGLYYCYYTAHPQRKGAVYCRTSKDTISWSTASMVAFGGAAGTNFTSAECPFVVELTPGEYYLFRTQRYGVNAITRVYRSLDPLDFGTDNDPEHLVGSLPVAAPELFRHNEQWFIASLLPSLKGIRIAKLEWRRSDQD